MATATNSYAGKNPEWKSQSMTGSLPDDFLCINATPEQQQEANDHETALALQRRTNARVTSFNGGGRLTIGVISAKLMKNYGMTRMDPYVRLRIGHTIFETHTDISGSRTPRWEKTIQCLLPPGIDTIHVEIFDECSFTADELIGWAYIQIPSAVIKEGKTIDEWFALSGKLGEGQEGHINLVLSFSNVAPTVMGTPLGPAYYPYQFPAQAVVPGAYVASPVVPAGAYMSGPVAPGVPVAPGHPPAVGVVQPQPTQPSALSAEDFKELQEMFPNVDEAVIKTVSENCRGDKSRAVNMILELSE